MPGLKKLRTEPPIPRLNILIVKLSSLGDVVHTMPAVQDIRRALPDARIDWVVERAFAPLVRRCAGVNGVIECELRRWRKAPWAGATRLAWAAFKGDLQQQSYDAVIDAQGLTKSALVSRLARLTPKGQRYAMANRTEGSAYEVPTRWAADRAIAVAAHSHAVARARDLCGAALGYVVPDLMSFGLLAPATQGPGATNIVALAHGTSRTDKQWPTENWIALGRRLHEAGYHVALPHGNDLEEQRGREIAASIKDAVVWPRLGLDALTDRLAVCAGVVGVDTGVSHMATALDLPHVQIYNFDTAWRTGPAGGRQVSVFASPAPSLQAVWLAWRRVTGQLTTTIAP